MRLFLFSLLYFLLTFSLYGNPFQLPKREIRAVWLTTIGGLDWPHTKAYSPLTIDKQKKELCQLLDKLQEANFNTVFLQTRIRGTVIYPSAIEPWDDCLTGHANKSPGYDPLEFAIEECHKRNLQLHAWVVVFPGHSFKKTKALGKQSMPARIPSLCMRTNDSWMLNPGVPQTAEYLAKVCQEITRNYDIDGIHLDYARYPEKTVQYNDALAYRKYGKGQAKSAWRRDNVTRCVKSIYSSVKQTKPWVWVSCSPVGKFKDLPSQSSLGWNAYSTVHQDAQGWIQTGIMDMLVPMMYFQAGRNFYPFALDWKENSLGKPIVNGLAAYKLDSREGDWPLNTIEKEVSFSRFIQSGGQAFFRTRHITDNNKAVYDYLNNFYLLPSLPYAMDWQAEALTPEPPQNLQLEETDDGYILKWNCISSNEPLTYNIYCTTDTCINTDNPFNIIYWQHKSSNVKLHLPISPELLPSYAVTAINRYGQESKPAYLINRTSRKASTREIIGEQLRLSYQKDSVLLPKCSSKFLIIEDKTGSIISTLSYPSTLYIGNLPLGIYTFRTLENKGRSHVLGTLINR